MQKKPNLPSIATHQDFNKEEQARLAGFWVRVAAHVLDALVLICGFIALSKTPWYDILINENKDNPLLFDYLLLGTLLFMWLMLGATPGKRLLHLKIVNAFSHTGITPNVAIRRLLGYGLSALPFGAGFIAIGINHDKQGFHDMLAKTQVIYAPSSEVARMRRFLVGCGTLFVLCWGLQQIDADERVVNQLDRETIKALVFKPSSDKVVSKEEEAFFDTRCYKDLKEVAHPGKWSRQKHHVSCELKDTLPLNSLPDVPYWYNPKLTSLTIRGNSKLKDISVLNSADNLNKLHIEATGKFEEIEYWPLDLNINNLKELDTLELGTFTVLDGKKYKNIATAVNLDIGRATVTNPEYFCSEGCSNLRGLSWSIKTTENLHGEFLLPSFPNVKAMSIYVRDPHHPLTRLPATIPSDYYKNLISRKKITSINLNNISNIESVNKLVFFLSSDVEVVPKEISLPNFSQIKTFRFSNERVPHASSFDVNELAQIERVDYLRVVKERNTEIYRPLDPQANYIDFRHLENIPKAESVRVELHHGRWVKNIDSLCKASVCNQLNTLAVNAYMEPDRTLTLEVLHHRAPNLTWLEWTHAPLKDLTGSLALDKVCQLWPNLERLALKVELSTDISPLLECGKLKSLNLVSEALSPLHPDTERVLNDVRARHGRNFFRRPLFNLPQYFTCAEVDAFIQRAATIKTGSGEPFLTRREFNSENCIDEAAFEEGVANARDYLRQKSKEEITENQNIEVKTD